MKSKPIRYAFILAAFAFLIPSLSFADHHDGEGRHKRKRGHFIEKMAEELELTEDQKTKLKEIHEKDRDSKKELHQKIRQARKDLNATLQSDANDSEVKVKFKTLQDLKFQKDEIRLQKILETRAILTPEQRVKFQAFKKDKHRKRFKHGKKHKRYRGDDEENNDQGEDS